MTTQTITNEPLFGTDGIRGTVGQFPMDETAIFKLGCALGHYFQTLQKPVKLVIGRDTRDSGALIERLLANGIHHFAQQTEIYSCSVIPTPGLSYVTRIGDFDYGIMITASHNPYTDNGIKIFSNSGEKIPQSMEKELETLFYAQTNKDYPVGMNQQTTIISDSTKTHNLYEQFLSAHGGEVPETRFNVVLDCANGATYQVAPALFKMLLPHLTIIHAAPDGKNINLNCGSTHTDSLAQHVKANHADLGIAFDGDGDRVLFVDNQGHLLDGDYILYVLAAYFLKTSADFKARPIVVGTVMANLGLEKALTTMGVAFTRTEVGDKYVYRELKQQNAFLGGEQSGHIVMSCFQPTGDGILTALYFLKALAFLSIHPDQVHQQFPVFPQVIKNITITHKKDLLHWETLQEMMMRFKEKYHEHSRLLIRYSGTEPKIRIMIESQYPEIIAEHLPRFEQEIRSRIGN